MFPNLWEMVGYNQTSIWNCLSGVPGNDSQRIRVILTAFFWLPKARCRQFRKHRQLQLHRPRHLLPEDIAFLAAETIKFPWRIHGILVYTLQEINISHLRRRKIIFRSALLKGYVSSRVVYNTYPWMGFYVHGKCRVNISFPWSVWVGISVILRCSTKNVRARWWWHVMTW